MTKMINEHRCRRRSGSETRVWSNFVDFLANPSVAGLYELMDLGGGAEMKALEPAGADRAYRLYVETCQRLGTKPIPWDAELAKWIETC
jgi:hypothetical protein